MQRVEQAKASLEAVGVRLHVHMINKHDNNREFGWKKEEEDRCNSKGEGRRRNGKNVV